MHPIAAVLLALPAQVAPSGGAGTAPPGMAAGINTILQWAKYIGYGIAMLGLIAAAAQMAIGHRQGGAGEHGTKVLASAAAAIIIGASIAIITALAT
jgi:hypothetical protein